MRTKRHPSAIGPRGRLGNFSTHSISFDFQRDLLRWITGNWRQIREFDNPIAFTDAHQCSARPCDQVVFDTIVERRSRKAQLKLTDGGTDADQRWARIQAMALKAKLSSSPKVAIEPMDNDTEADTTRNVLSEASALNSMEN